MSYSDMTITCRDCGKEFVFTAGEQEFYAQKGFLNEPVRCPECRKARKRAVGRKRGGGNDDGGGNRQRRRPSEGFSRD